MIRRPRFTWMWVALTGVCVSLTAGDGAAAAAAATPAGPLKVDIIGAGHIGSALATLWSRDAHLLAAS